MSLFVCKVIQDRRQDRCHAAACAYVIENRDEKSKYFQKDNDGDDIADAIVSQYMRAMIIAFVRDKMLFKPRKHEPIITNKITPVKVRLCLCCSLFEKLRCDET